MSNTGPGEGNTISFDRCCCYAEREDICHNHHKAKSFHKKAKALSLNPFLVTYRILKKTNKNRPNTWVANKLFMATEWSPQRNHLELFHTIQSYLFPTSEFSHYNFRITHLYKKVDHNIIFFSQNCNQYYHYLIALMSS